MVPLGAKIPNHALISQLGKPTSEAVGISGNADIRFLDPTARGLRSPDLTYDLTVPYAADINWSLPAKMSVMAEPIPL